MIFYQIAGDNQFRKRSFTGNAPFLTDAFVFVSYCAMVLILVASVSGQTRGKKCLNGKDGRLINTVLSLTNFKDRDDRTSKHVYLSNENLPTDFCLDYRKQEGIELQIVDKTTLQENSISGIEYYEFEPLLRLKNTVRVSLMRFSSTATGGYSYNTVVYSCGGKKDRWRCNVSEIRMGQT